jgi:alkylation response protein AidB-like acyl-CoA dehydrogenase
VIKDAPFEELEAFRARARSWLSDNMQRLPACADWDPVGSDDDRANRGRALQRRVWEGGFAGICYPRQYGGLGLPIEYQRAFDVEAYDYELPYIFSTPTMSIIGPTILDCGTEQQKQRYIPQFLRGEELWVQFMSEPAGGSDMAGALTRATRDGDVFILNGSKIWSSSAYRADYAIALVRTNWEVPKHSGLTVVLVPVRHPGITINQIEMIDGNKEFCQEFFDNVDVPVANVLGAVDDGWSVASRLLFHERAAVGGSSPYLSVARTPGTATETDLAHLVMSGGSADDPEVQRLLGESEALSVVQQQLIRRVTEGIMSGYYPNPAGSILRLFEGMSAARHATIALEMAGQLAVSWAEDGQPSKIGIHYLQRQARSIGGGTTEMARNVISERVLGMPREPATDRDEPFSEVLKARRR